MNKNSLNLKKSLKLSLGNTEIQVLSLSLGERKKSSLSKQSTLYFI